MSSESSRREHSMFLTCLTCFTSTILGTNGLNSDDVPLSNKQTNVGAVPTVFRDHGVVNIIFIILYVPLLSILLLLYCHYCH